MLSVVIENVYMQAVGAIYIDEYCTGKQNKPELQHGSLQTAMVRRLAVFEYA